MREAMRALAQSIVASHEARATGLASIRRDVSAHRERARRHVQGLEATRREAARTLHGHLAKGRAGLKASVSAQLQGLDAAHQAMARQQRQGLAKVHTGLNRAETKRKAGVRSWMEEVASAHQAMAQGQRETLARVHSDLALAGRQRKAGVRSWMEEVAAAHGAAREEWQNLASTMRAKRAGVAVAEAPPEVAPAAEEEAIEVGEVTEELASLSARAFAYLANHPDGTRLTEVEQEFGLGRFQAARVVRHLMNEGKARKQGLLYFAT